MATKKMTKKQKEKVVRQASTFFLKHKVLSIILALVIVIGAVGYYFFFIKKTPKEIKGDLSFHFIFLGNDSPGDSIYVRAGDNDILIDAGSETNSKNDIIDYLKKYMKDDVLEYVIVTHGDDDHYACFACDGGIFDTFKCKTIIDFVDNKVTYRDQTYENYLLARDQEVLNTAGGVRHSALECCKEENGAKKIYNLADSISMEILYNYYYDNEPECSDNNKSVCVMFHHGDSDFLFTGDLESAGEKKLVDNNDFGNVKLYKAGHHGSNTSSSQYLLSVIEPEICVVTCVCGGKYDFPSQKFIDRISGHTTSVYCPCYKNNDSYALLNGDIVVISNKDGVRVECSNNNTLLKDTTWFKNEREMPSGWIR